MEHMTREQAAEYLNISVDALAMHAYRGSGPPYVRLGHRTIRYRKADLDQWLEDSVVTPGADKRSAAS
jgi:excisionase family DNA binding protein